jgi:RND family efflux transporter MFP subunit
MRPASRKHRVCRLRWLAFPLLTSLTLAGDGPSPSRVVVLKNCEVEYDRVTTIGAFVLVQAGGRVQDMYVRPGDRVKAGQILGRLHDRDAVVELQRYKHEAEDDVDIRLGTAKLAVAKAKLKRSESLLARNTQSIEALQYHQLETQAAELEIEAGKHRRRSAELIARRMEAEVRSREFVSPHDGTVVEIIKNVGESCICNEPVMKIVHDDTLWVVGYLDIGDAWKLRKGQPVRLVPEIQGAEVPEVESLSFAGRVVFVEARIDPITQTCKVVAEFDNRERLLRSGMRARMEIDYSGLSAPEERAIRPGDRPSSSLNAAASQAPAEQGRARRTP